MKMKKMNVPDFYSLHKAFKPIFRENSDTWLVFKIFLMVFVVTVVTIVIHKYTFFVESSNEKKMKRIHQEKVDNFIETFASKDDQNGMVENERIAGANSVGDDRIFRSATKENEKEPTEYLWEKETNPFSFNSNSIFQKRYGFLDETTDNLENYQEGFEGSTLEGFQEGFIRMPDFSGIFNAIADIGNKIGEAFRWFERIGTWVDDTIIKPTRSWFQNIFDEIKSFKERFVRLGYGLRDLMYAIRNTFVTFGYAVATEVTDVGNLMVGGGECVANFANNFRFCSLFYFIDLILSMLFNGFMMIPWGIDSIAGTNLTEQIDSLYTLIEKVDNFIKKSLGVSVIHYPKSIINTCYTCQDVNFTRLVDQLYSDTADINRSFRDLGQQYEHAGNQLMSVFAPDDATNNIKNSTLKLGEEYKKAGDRADFIRPDDDINSVRSSYLNLGQQYVNSGDQLRSSSSGMKVY
jgi:hypothetical protein